jgi:hypothetical protein
MLAAKKQPKASPADSRLAPHRQHPEGRPIRWGTWDFTGLDDAARVLAGRSWDERMKQEHLAVGAFSMVVTELAEDGCEPVVLSLMTRAASDEVRHAEICRLMAVELLGEGKVASRVKGIPSIPKHIRATPSTRALLHVVEMCCLSETLTGVFLTEMLAPLKGTPRSAVESLLEDEIDHGRVGWAYLASRAREKRLEGLPEALPAMLDRTVGKVFDMAKKRPEDDTKPLRAVGYVGTNTAARLFEKTLRDVILPGFETCGVDVGPSRAHAVEHGWL